ncbi:MAG: hypothetical protein ACRCZ0_08555 [Cetobacterium sp.]
MTKLLGIALMMLVGTVSKSEIVKYTKDSSSAHKKVYITKYKSEADEIWYETRYKSEADEKTYIKY